MNAEFLQPTTQQKLFGDWIELRKSEARLDVGEETLRFKQLHYSAYMLSSLYRRAIKTQRSTIQAQYATWLGRYHMLRQRLVDANLGLVFDAIRRHRFRITDHDEAHSEGMLALLRAVDTFDPWRGFRFSTYACNTISRALSRSNFRDARRRATFTVAFDPDIDGGGADTTPADDVEVLQLERLRNIMRENGAKLSTVERDVLQKRFPRNDESDAQTFRLIASDMRISKERVRQIQRTALVKLRRAMERQQAS
jgi:RNA polymerase sigma factor (sigma-70 family)